MTRDLVFLRFFVAFFTHVVSISTQDLTSRRNKFPNDLKLLKINLVYNRSFKHLKRSDIHKKRPIAQSPTSLSTKMNNKTTI